MIRENSPTLQRMIDSVKGGEGSFQQPYPSPKDMVMQAGMNSAVYNPAYQLYSSPQAPQVNIPEVSNIPNPAINESIFIENA